MRHIHLALAAALAALIASGCAAEGQTRREQRQDRIAERKGTETISIAGRDRSYIVHDFSRPGVKAPVVILLHGGGGSSENAVNMTQFDAVARREGLIAVYPEGTSAGGPFMTWNAGHCCAYASENKVDDVSFVSAVIDRLVASGKADARRVYVTGMSNGAMMSHRLGRELSDKVAGIAPVVGAVFGDEPAPKGPVPAVIIVGAIDTVVPPEGGDLQLRGALGNRSAADAPVAPAIKQAHYWATANGCRNEQTGATAASTYTRWTGCKNGADVVFHVVADNGHAWPGGRPGRQGAPEPTKAFNASEEMWAFFKAHPKM